MIRARPLFAPAVAVLPCLASAPAAAMDTVWCSDDGTLYLPTEEMSTRLGFNEHTICGAETPIMPALEGGQIWLGQVECRNVYVVEVHDDGSVETEEIEHITQVLTIARDGAEVAVTYPDGVVARYQACGY